MWRGASRTLYLGTLDVPFLEAAMGSNSTQGVAVLVLLVAFTFLSVSLYFGGSILFLLLAVVTMGGAVAMFRRVKPLENER
jgi:hypothetical protein